MGFSNSAVGILNFITMVLSIPILGAGIWLAARHSSDCYKFLQWPVIILGLFILLVSLAGFFGSCCRMKCLLWLYLVVMFLLILLLFIFTIFAFVVTNKGAGEVISNKGYKEYKLGDYSNWLQKQVSKASNWDKIQSCLSDAKVCSSLNDKYLTQADFDKAELSPLESGCCKPPTGCACQFVNATIWKTCATPAYSPDCTNYQAITEQLCYTCDSCKAGALQNIKQDWRKVAVVNVVMLVFLIIVYSLGCCAFRNAKREGYGKRYP